MKTRTPFVLSVRAATALLFVAFVACGAPEPMAEPETEEAAGLSPAERLIARSIAHHDPNGLWNASTVTARIVESRPNGVSRSSEIMMNAGAGEFSLARETEDRTTGFRVSGEEIVSRSVDGATDLDEAAFEEAGLAAETVMRLRDYYLYLWGLPMKLRDAGTIIEPSVEDDAFNDQPVERVRVTYDPEVGGDTWYFYFEPGTARLVGYRFHHDEAKNDGEFVVLEGEILGDGLRLPAKRVWYWNDSGETLGEDEAVALSAVPTTE